jgi:hypothetical protein
MLRGMSRAAPLRAAPQVLLALLAALGCASTTPSSTPPTTLAVRFQDAALDCDDDGNVYVGATEIFSDSKQILVAASNRYGESWNRRFHYVSGSLQGDRGRPQLATGAPREVYVLWEDTRHGGVDLFFNRSLDAGNSWLDADVQVNAGIQRSAALAAPVLSCDRRGNVYVVWREEREGFQALYVNSSRDRGDTWAREPVRLTALSMSLKSPPVAVCDEEGRLHVTWIEIDGNAATVHVNVSTDHGRSWNWDSRILGQLSPTATLFRPALAVGPRGSVFVAWSDVQAGRRVVFLSRSLDHGTSWEALPRVLRSPGPALNVISPPSLRCDRFGHLYVIWQGVAANASRVFVVQSSADDGATFGETRVPRTGTWRPEQELLPPERRPRDFRASADDTGNLYLAWTEGGTAVRGVGFDRVSNHGSTWLGLPHAVGTSTHLPRTPEAPLLCNDSSGHVFLLWNEGHTLTVATSPFYGDSGWRYEHF